MIRPTVYLIKHRIINGVKAERGSFTIESVFVFPIILSIILMFMVLGMYLWQKDLIYYSTALTSERAAFSWDNSHRDPVSGILLKPEYDGLYRKLGSNGVLGSLFGTIGEEAKKPAIITLPIGENSSDSSGANTTSNEDLAVSESANGSPEQKLERAAAWMKKAGLSNAGRASFTNKMLSDLTVVQLEQGMRMFPWQTEEESVLISQSLIVDPVEFIRSVDLTRYYTDKLLHSSMGKKDATKNAGKVLSSYQAKKGL